MKNSKENEALSQNKRTRGNTMADWKKSYKIGYNSGSNDYGYIGRKFGCRFLASIGYRNGMRAAYRLEKHLKKLGKEQ